jgi:transcriptional regulator with XRE-family HTH domain
MALKLVSSFSERFSEALGDSSSSYFALCLGLSKQTISAYKNGTRKPKSPTIKEIARELNVSETWLLGYDVPKNDVSDLVRPLPENYTILEIQRLMNADPDTLNEVQRQAVMHQKTCRGYKSRFYDPAYDEELLMLRYRALNDEGKAFICKTMEVVYGNHDYVASSNDNFRNNEKSEHN